MIYLNIEAASIDDLKKQMREVLGQTEQPSSQPAVNLCSGTSGQEQAGQTDSSPTANTSGQAEGEPKAEKEPPKEEPPKEEPPKEEPVKAYSLVEVRAAANAYRDKHGIEKLRGIFRKHGGEKLRDIPEGSYAALMEDIA